MYCYLVFQLNKSCNILLIKEIRKKLFLFIGKKIYVYYSLGKAVVIIELVHFQLFDNIIYTWIHEFFKILVKSEFLFFLMTQYIVFKYYFHFVWLKTLKFDSQLSKLFLTNEYVSDNQNKFLPLQWISNYENYMCPLNVHLWDIYIKLLNDRLTREPHS